MVKNLLENAGGTGLIPDLGRSHIHLCTTEDQQTLQLGLLLPTLPESQLLNFYQHTHIYTHTHTYICTHIVRKTEAKREREGRNEANDKNWQPRGRIHGWILTLLRYSCNFSIDLNFFQKKLGKN